jgi:ribosome biogenesis protein Tsr3
MPCFFIFDKNTCMPVALNNTQLEILKLFRNDQTEEELQEIKSLLIAYLADKVVIEADKSFGEKGYTTAIFEKWKQEHFRKTA